MGTTVGRVMADDGDIGVNAKIKYSLDDLEESSTFTIQTDPNTQEGIIILSQVKHSIFDTLCVIIYHEYK